jgi:uncharacterized protein YndB with AHSA1/START domain
VGGSGTARRTLRRDDNLTHSVSSVTASIEIAAPPTEVWQTVMDPKRLGDWVTIHRGLRKADEGPVSKGFKMDQRIHLRGVTLDVRWRLAECQVNRHAVWEGRGPARSRARTEYTLHELGNGGTRFEYANEFHTPLGPLGTLVSRALVGGMPEREATRTLQRLRDLLEH